MQGFGRKYTKNLYFYGNPICQRSNRLSRGGIGAEIIFKKIQKDTKRYEEPHLCSLPLKQLYVFNIIKDHARTLIRTQKGQRSQTVSTALSVAIITRQPYLMKAFSVVAPIYDICSMGGVKLNIRFTIIPFWRVFLHTPFQIRCKITTKV